MQRFFSLYFIVLAISMSFCSKALCDTVIIDPGAGGTSFKEKTFTFDDLNGRSIDTIISPLEFDFPDEKFITLNLKDDPMFNVSLTLTLSNSGTGYVPVTGGSLRHGESRINNNDQSSAGGGNTDTYTISWYTWNDPAIDGFVFSKVYFNSIRFRDYPAGTTIESASLKLQVWGSVHNGYALIGPAANRTIFPVKSKDGKVSIFSME